MFENTAFSKLEIGCPQHPKTRVSTICTDLQCLHPPLLCGNCLNEFNHKGKHLYHESHLRNLLEGLNDLTVLLQNDRPAMQRLSKLVCRKENEELIRWEEEKQKHANSIDNHINSLKYQLTEESRNIVRIFQQSMQETRCLFFKELDLYSKTYKENFEIFSKLVQPLISYNHGQKHYSEINNLILKLYTEPKKKVNDWLLQLKSTLTFTQKTTASTASFEELLDRATTYMNAMIDSLPTVQFDEQKTAKSMKILTNQLLKSSIRICDLKSLNLILSTVDTEEKKAAANRRIFDEKPNLVKKQSNR